VRGAPADEVDHLLARQQVAAAHVRRAERLGQPVEDDDPLAIVRRERPSSALALAGSPSVM